MSQKCWVLGAKRNKKEADFKKLQCSKPAISSCYLILALILNLHLLPHLTSFQVPHYMPLLYFTCIFAKVCFHPSATTKVATFLKQTDKSQLCWYVWDDPHKRLVPAPPPALSLSMSQYTPWSSYTWRHQHICIILFVLSWMFFFLFSVWY